jgi:hypothetical protein
MHMSRLLDRDSNFDEPSPYAPKWVRDAAHAERHGTAPKPQVAAEDRDAQQSTEVAASDQSQQLHRPTRSASPAPREGLVIDRYRLPRSLEPTIMSEPLDEHRCRVVKTTGDGMLVEFASVVDALRYAIEIRCAGKALPLIIFHYQSQPATLEPSGKAFRHGGPRRPGPDHPRVPRSRRPEHPPPRLKS